MLYTYAIEPDALATWDKCRRLLDLMGFQHGRAIAAYPTPKRWKKLVHTSCLGNAGTGDRDRKRVLEKLRQADAKLVRSDGADDYDDAIAPAAEAECWIRNAVARQTAAPTFHAILATRNPEGHPDVVLEEDVEESHDKLHVPREQPVPRQPAELAAHVATLVRNSRELLLIDPHLDLSKPRWRPVVAACLALVATSFKDNPNAEIHTLDADRKCSSPDFQRHCKTHLPKMIVGKLTSVRIRRWRIRADRPHDFHARYVLTDRGGYKLDKGLDEEHGMEQPVGLLDDREWQRLREGYGDANSFFEKSDDDFTLDRSGVLRPEPPAGGRLADRPE